MVCNADVEQIFISLANNAKNEIIGIINCSKFIANSSALWKQNETDVVSWWHWSDHYIVETYAMPNKY